MRLPDFCNRHTITSTLRTARLPNHPHLRLSPRVMASTAARPAEALANDVTSGKGSLDGEPLASARSSMSLGSQWATRD